MQMCLIRSVFSLDALLLSEECFHLFFSRKCVKKKTEFDISFLGHYHIILSHFPLNIKQILNNVVWGVMCAGLGFCYLNEDILE